MRSEWEHHKPMTYINDALCENIKTESTVRQANTFFLMDDIMQQEVFMYVESEGGKDSY